VVPFELLIRHILTGSVSQLTLCSLWSVTSASPFACAGDQAATFVVNAVFVASKWQHQRGPFPCTHSLTPSMRVANSETVCLDKLVFISNSIARNLALTGHWQSRSNNCLLHLVSFFQMYINTQLSATQFRLMKNAEQRKELTLFAALDATENTKNSFVSYFLILSGMHSAQNGL